MSDQQNLQKNISSVLPEAKKKKKKKKVLHIYFAHTSTSYDFDELKILNSDKII